MPPSHPACYKVNVVDEDAWMPPGALANLAVQLAHCRAQVIVRQKAEISKRPLVWQHECALHDQRRRSLPYCAPDRFDSCRPFLDKGAPATGRVVKAGFQLYGGLKNDNCLRLEREQTGPRI